MFDKFLKISGLRNFSWNFPPIVIQLEFPESIVENALDSPLDELVAAHLRACWAVAKNDFLEAYKCQALAGK